MLLLVTGVGKLLDVPGFMGVIASYAVFPIYFIPAVAVLMVVTELRLAEALMRRATAVPAALFCSGLHLLFAAWGALALLRGLDIPNCGCFGVFFARPLTWGTVGEDLAVAAFSTGIFWGYQKIGGLSGDTTAADLSHRDAA